MLEKNKQLLRSFVTFPLRSHIQPCYPPYGMQSREKRMGIENIVLGNDGK